MKESTEKRLVKINNRIAALDETIRKAREEKAKLQEQADAVMSAELLSAYKNSKLPVESISEAIAIGSHMQQAGYTLKDTKELVSEPVKSEKGGLNNA